MEDFNPRDFQIRDLALTSLTYSTIKSIKSVSYAKLYSGVIIDREDKEDKDVLAGFVADLNGFITTVSLGPEEGEFNFTGLNLRLWRPDLSFRQYFFVFDKSSRVSGRVLRKEQILVREFSSTLLAEEGWFTRCC